MTITLGMWVLPTIITFSAFFWALCIVKPGSGWFSGLPNVLALIPASVISLASWVAFSIYLVVTK